MNQEPLVPNSKPPFSIVKQEQKRDVQKWIFWGGVLIMILLLLATWAHATSLVLEYTKSAESGILFAIRVVSPGITELFTAVVGAGFLANAWRASQKTWGLLIELVWVLFAAFNLITSFNIAGGGSAEAGFLYYWLHYGLPLSALIVGSMFYAMYRSNPEHLRDEEATAADELIKASEFEAMKRVLLSPEMEAIRLQKSWLDYVASLELAGYPQEHIEFMLEQMPELRAVTQAKRIPQGNPAAPKPFGASPDLPELAAGLGNGDPGLTERAKAALLGLLAQLGGRPTPTVPDLPDTVPSPAPQKPQEPPQAP